ncbi:MAG: molybdopterin-dependent oxidoreductase [Actinomycetota bacterium]
MRRAIGIIPAGLALAVLWAGSSIDPAVSFPPLALAERLVRLAPGDAATFFIDALGYNAVRLLALGTTMAFLAFGALLPRLPERFPPWGAGLIFGAAAAGATLGAPMRPRAAWAVLGGAAAAVLYAVPLAWLVDLTETDDAPGDRGRRRALLLIGSAAAAMAAGGTTLGRIGRRLAGPRTDVAISAPDVMPTAPARPPFPRIPGLSPEVTSTADHYVVDIDLVDPVVEVEGWSLAIGGLVERPALFTFFDLQRRFRIVEEHSVLTCISNPVGGPLVGSSSWTGVRLRDVLSMVVPRDGAQDVVFRCADGYVDSLTLEAAMEPSVLLAVAQNGRPLTWQHGFPCRLRAPAFYGVKNVKWLEEIEIVGFDARGYWTRRGWSERAKVRTQSRIETSFTDARAGEPMWIAGTAWAGTRGVSRVEVSVDGGRVWKEAVLNPPLSRLAWTQWAYRWTPPTPGRYLVRCRATDGEGILQDATERPPHPSGASGYHSEQVMVR